MSLWTPQHAKTLLPAFIAMLILGILLRKTIGKKSWNVRMIPFRILACVLIALEIGKQGVSLMRGYDLYHLPFHFCSLFIFAIPLMAFYQGKNASALRTVVTSLSAAMSLLLLIYPDLIYGAGNIESYFTDYMSFHTVTFHNAVLLEFVLILALELHAPGGNAEQKPVLWSVVGFCVVSATMAHLLKTNYANFYTCNIAPLETVRLAVKDAVGAVPAQLLYVLIVSLLNILFVWGSYWLFRFLYKVFAQKKTETPC